MGVIDSPAAPLPPAPLRNSQTSILELFLLSSWGPLGRLGPRHAGAPLTDCLLYTSDAADDTPC
eukprot:6133097-Pyramimonas_sp.AAC.1